MHARVSTYRGSADTIDRSLAKIDEVSAAVRGIDGSRGLIYLSDRETGVSVSITLWEDAEAMRASEEAANQLRRDSTVTVGETIAAVDRYEVAAFDVPESAMTPRD